MCPWYFTRSNDGGGLDGECNEQQIPHPLRRAGPPEKAAGFGMTDLGGWLGDWQDQMEKQNKNAGVKINSKTAPFENHKGCGTPS
jgi:hypothetical protein